MTWFCKLFGSHGHTASATSAHVSHLAVLLAIPIVLVVLVRLVVRKHSIPKRDAAERTAMYKAAFGFLPAR